MDFTFSDQQLSLRETSRRFAVEKIAPVAAEYDQSGKFPRGLIQNAWELGFTGTCVPQEMGGLGLPMLDSCIMVEELAWGCSGITTSIMCNDLGLMPIFLSGTDDQKKEWLAPCAASFKLVSFCLSEPNAGSDVAGLQLLAEPDGDDYILNGTKCWITNGGEADLYTVFATFDRSSRHKGICAFVVAPRYAPGLSPGKKEDKMGQRASDTCVVHFDNVRVSKSQRLGAEGEGFQRGHADARPDPPVDRRAGRGHRATGPGGMHRLCASERKAFGFPIGSFQAVQFMLADMAKDIEAARLLTHQSAWMVDRRRASLQAVFLREVFCDRYGDEGDHRRRTGLWWATATRRTIRSKS